MKLSKKTCVGCEYSYNGAPALEDECFVCIRGIRHDLSDAAVITTHERDKVWEEFGLYPGEYIDMYTTEETQ